MFPDNLVTVPRENEALTLVDDAEVILRRYDPDNSEIVQMVTVDLRSEPSEKLTQQAFTGFSDGGCSVARAEVLRQAGVAVDEFLDPKYRRYARAVVEKVRRFAYSKFDGTVTRPFDVLPDSYPSDEPNPKKWMVAHAVITVDGLTRAEKTVAVGALARSVFEVMPIGATHP